MPAPRRKAATRLSLVTAGRVELGRHVDAVTAEQVRVWSAAWQTTYDDLVRAAAAAASAPDGSLGAAHRTARLDASLAALTGQLRALGKRQGVTVAGLIPPAVSIPVEVQHQLAGAAGLVWNLPPERALASIVQRTSEQVASRYLVLTATAEEELRKAMVRGIAAGEGPRAAARQLVAATQSATALSLGTSLDDVRAGRGAEAIVREVQGAFAGGLARANNLMRTELLDASRLATRDSYLANPGLVGGWRWLSTQDRRTCPACWGMHNTVHPASEQLEGHQSCRCAPVPILAGDDELDPRTGRTLDDLGHPDDAFRKLDREDQLRILGPKRLEAFDNGTPLRAFAKHQQNTGWRDSYHVAPLSELPPSPGPGRAPRPAPRPPAPPRPPEAEVPAYVAEVRQLLDQLPADRSLLGMTPAETDLDVVAQRMLDNGAYTSRNQRRAVELRKQARKSDREADAMAKRAHDPRDLGYLRSDAQRFREEADRVDADLEAQRLDYRAGLESGRYQLNTRPMPDQLPDGGPGAVGEQHLDVVKRAGAVVQRQLEQELADDVGLQAKLRERQGVLDELAAHDAKHQALAAQRDARRTALREQAREEWRQGKLPSGYGSARRGSELEDADAALIAIRTELRALSSARFAVLERVQAFAGIEAEARRDLLRAILSRIRPQGTAGTLDLVADSAKAAKFARSNGTKVLPGPQPWAVEAMRHAELFYPQAWLDRIPGELHLVGVDRGFAYGDVVALSDDGGRRIIASAPRADRVAIHELGHHMEQNVPGMRMLEWLQQWHRTTDAGVVKSGPNKGHRRRTGDNGMAGMSGLPASERARADKYANPYTGKEYAGGTPASSWELFTTSAESLFAGSAYTDADLEAWALGVLVAL